MTTPAPEQLNLKVKSQVTPYLPRTEKKSSSKLRALPSSKNLWTPTAKDKVYQLINPAQCQQRPLPFRRRAPAWDQDTQRPQHVKRRWDRRRDWTSWRLIISMILHDPPSNVIKISLLHPQITVLYLVAWVLGEGGQGRGGTPFWI